MTLFTYPEFVFFCEAFQRLNHFDFDPVDIVAELKEDQTHYTYEGMYRDESNYKSHVELTYDGEDVRWNIAMGWEDADGELCALYDAMLI
ncbi:hypothetical protein [Paenibacillus sp. 1P07SE]|uniref:hypothetical protein n=1 Tax=Paenibacillus sp. 1P07SE TaxID=3132209 RepID=UPI0039A5566E